MNWGQPAKAGPDTSENSENIEKHDGVEEKQAPKEEGGWLSRALPNFSYIWDKIPEPTEARRKWDERQNRGASSVRSQAEFYAP